MEQIEFKGGRKPPVHKDSIKFANILTGAVPTGIEIPMQADYLKDFESWLMYLNNKYGTCVPTTWAHERRLMTKALSGKEFIPTVDQVIELYKTQNPGFPSQDDGMVIQLLLEYLVKYGGPDGVKPLAFAQVNVRNPDELSKAIAIFGCGWAGIDVSDANMNQFDKGKPWDYVRRSIIRGGHSIIVGGYDQKLKKFITWTKETGFTDAFRMYQLEEFWVVIWPEHLGNKAFMEGIDLVALAKNYEELTGRDFPVDVTPKPTPVPDPVPTPEPTPVPVPDPPAPSPTSPSIAVTALNDVLYSVIMNGVQVVTNLSPMDATANAANLKMSNPNSTVKISISATWSVSLL